MGIVLLPLMMIYFILAGGILILVIKYTKRKLYRYLAVAVLILIPAWDVILGLIIYLPACHFVPKVSIYETAETDGIYYEGMHDYIYELEGGSDSPVSERINVGTISEVFRKENYTYAEAKVTKKRPYAGSEYHQTIPPVYYHCTSLPPDPRAPQFQRMSCVVVDQPQSQYMVKESTFEIFTVTVNKLQIINRTTGKLMAENHSVSRIKTLPFFNWLYDPSSGPPECVTCSDFKRYQKKEKGHFFEYYVLKPKQ
jgi:hypothetical protein